MLSSSQSAAPASADRSLALSTRVNAEIRQVALVEGEHALVEVAEQVERFDADVGSVQAALQEAPEVFDSVGVDAAVDVLLGVVDGLVGVVVLQARVVARVVRVERSAGLDMLSNVAMGVPNDADVRGPRPWREPYGYSRS